MEIVGVDYALKRQRRPFDKGKLSDGYQMFFRPLNNVLCLVGSCIALYAYGSTRLMSLCDYGYVRSP